MKAAGVFIISLFVAWAGYGSDSQEAKRERQRPDSELKQDDPQAALANDEASQTKDSRAEAYRLRAEAILDSSRFRRALKDAEAGLKLDPDNRQLRELRDLAAAHLKLANREASIVENARYPTGHEPASLPAAPVEPLSFGDLAQQRQELRELVEQNPFWQRASAVEREAYIQHLLDTDQEFLALTISHERWQLVDDKSKDIDHHNESDLDLLVTFAHLSPLSNAGQVLEDVERGGSLLLSREYRSAVLQGFLEAGIKRDEMASMWDRRGGRLSWEPIEFGPRARELQMRMKLATGQLLVRNRGGKEYWKILSEDKSSDRLSSADIAYGKFERQAEEQVRNQQARIYNFSFGGMGASR